MSSLRPDALLATLIRLRDENHANLSTFLRKTTPASACINFADEVSVACESMSISSQVSCETSVLNEHAFASLASEDNSS